MRASAAMSKTRALNSSHSISRLRNRAGSLTSMVSTARLAGTPSAGAGAMSGAEEEVGVTSVIAPYLQMG